MLGLVPLFIDTREGRVAQALELMFNELNNELTALLNPLKALAQEELHALGSEHTTATVGSLWEANEQVLRRLLPRDVRATIALPSPSDGANTTRHLAPADDEREAPPAYGGGGQLIAHLARDWSEAGAPARRRAHPAVLRALRKLRRAARVLVPGAGVCRLAWEIASAGYRVEANDAAVQMLMAGRSLIAWTGPTMDVYPHLRCATGTVRRSACHAAATLPDVAPSSRDAQHLTLQAGDFLQMYAAALHRAAWDAVVTCYFIDTMADPIAAVRRIEEVLAPGGLWINFGPLHWHEQRAGLLRLSYEELLALLTQRGFVIEVSRRVAAVPYLGGPRDLLTSSSNSWHDCLFFVARKARGDRGREMPAVTRRTRFWRRRGQST